MTIFGEKSFLERMQFFDGQRLFASDLQSLEADNRERLWRHNASLHQPGVGSGYAVTGNKGDREVTISAGYAIDVFGREIILTTTRTEPVPPVADNGNGQPIFFDLTVSYPDDSALEESELREGVCSPRGVIRLREEPIFCWIKLKADGQAADETLKQQIQDGIKVRLARAEIFDCQLNNPVSVAQRRNARPPRQPYIASSRVFPDASWKIKPVEDPLSGPGFEIKVDTSSAGFVTTPCYTAHIVGDRFFSKTKYRDFDAVFNAIKQDQFMLDGLSSIFDSTARDFKFRVLMPEIELLPALRVNPREFFLPGIPEKEEKVRLLRTAAWSVVWVGVEG